MPKSTPGRTLAQIQYDPTTGVLYAAGAPLGTVNAHGYVVLRVDNKLMYAHRVAWYLHYGCWPDGALDHINGVRSDNRVGNLRSVSTHENAQNTVLRKTSKGNPPGAHLHAPTGRYKSAICVKGRNVHLGYYDTPEDASEMYLLAKEMLHINQEFRYA